MESSKEVSFRRATLQDRDGVLDIGRNIYNGIDYLAHYYAHYAADPRRHCFVAELNGVIVGFAIAFVIDNGTRCVIQAARVTENLRGLSIYKKLLQHLKQETTKSFPSLTQLTFTTWSHNPAIKKASFWEVHQEVLRRFYYVRAIDLAQLETALASVQHHIQSGIETFTSPMLAQLLVSPERVELFPGNRIMCNWLPFELLADNAPIIIDQTSTLFWSKDNDRVVSVSLSCLMRVTLGPRLDIDIYGTDVDTTISHILLTLQTLLQQGKLSNETYQLLISVDMRVERAPIDLLLDQMGFKDGVLPSCEQFTLVAPIDSQSE